MKFNAPLFIPRINDDPTVRRFLSKVRIVKPKLWEWTGARCRKGYGRMRIRIGERWHVVAAHRVSYAIFCGDVPSDMHVHHRGDDPVPWNVSPLELEVMDAIENSRDGRRRQLRRQRDGFGDIPV